MDEFPPGSNLTRLPSKLAPSKETAGMEMGIESGELECHDALCRPPDHRGSCFVMLENNIFRVAWTWVMSGLLLYTATFFIWHLVFVDFRINNDKGTCSFNSMDCAYPNWFIFDEVVNAFFCMDLFLSFLFSYTDPESREEVDSLFLIGTHYLKGAFMLNLLACFPQWVSDQLTKKADGSLSSGPAFQRTVRLVRIQRVSRLVRLTKLGRLVNIVSSTSTHPAWQRMQRLRGIRLISFVLWLFFIVHLLACGWYLCAALHFDAYDQTWVSRRHVGEGSSIALYQESPISQWVQSMYFVLTVFTTVGFGDIYPVTIAEITYVAMLMVVGAVVNSIMLSEVIGIVTAVGDYESFLAQQHDLVRSFALHTELDKDSESRLKDWISQSATNWFRCQYNREEMKLLITSKGMPRSLLGRLPQKLFSEKLCKNYLLNVCAGLGPVPPRLPLLLALSMTKLNFEAGEIVYQVCDFPFNVFLVINGTFAHVARPMKEGGLDCMPTVAAGLECHDNMNGIRADTPGIKADTPDREGVKTLNMAQICNRSNYEGMPDQRGASITSEVQNSKPEVQPEQLYPYQLFGFNSYVGEMELFRRCPRYATLRCESPKAAVLVLRKEDLQNLGEEFPRFASAWRHEANRRDSLRRNSLTKLTRGIPYRAFAAVKIQTFVRDYFSRSGMNKSNLVEAAERGRFRFPKRTHSGFWERSSHPPRDDRSSYLVQEVQHLRMGMEAMHEGMNAIRNELREMRAEQRAQRQQAGSEDAQPRSGGDIARTSLL